MFSSGESTQPGRYSDIRTCFKYSLIGADTPNVAFLDAVTEPESSIKKKTSEQRHCGGQTQCIYMRSEISRSCGMSAHFGMLGSGRERWKWPPRDPWPSNETFCQVANNGLFSGGAPASATEQSIPPPTALPPTPSFDASTGRHMEVRWKSVTLCVKDSTWQKLLHEFCGVDTLLMWKQLRVGYSGTAALGIKQEVDVEVRVSLAASRMDKINNEDIRLQLTVGVEAAGRRTGGRAERKGVKPRQMIGWGLACSEQPREAENWTED